MKTKGLTYAQVAASREKFGSNALTEIKGDGFWKKLWKNFGDPMIRILCVALAINIVFAALGKTEWFEPVGIAVAVLLATLVSTFSEYKNENSFRKLQDEASKIKCKVYRNGTMEEISVDDVVVGDYVMLQMGDKVPADGFLADGTVKVDQSVLNGEAKEAPKIPVPENYVDTDTGVDFFSEYKLYRGSVVCNGSATLCVESVGDKTVYGRIASELQADDGRDSPLKVKLKKLAKKISTFGYIGGIVIALAFIFQKFFMNNGFDAARIAEYFSNWETPVQDAITAVELAVVIMVMAIPEGLPLMIAIVSAQNMGKMLKDNVLVRKVEGIETAGSINLLFSDKTGTITKGNLEAVLFVDGKGNEYKEADNVIGGLGKLLSLSIRNNTNAVVTGSGNDVRVLGGNATERAVLGFAARGHGSAAEKVAVIDTIPFNSTNKYSATSISSDNGGMTLIKGAPEKILVKCTGYFDEEGNEVKCGDFSVLNAKIDALADRAIRVLALAVSKGKISDESLPEDDWTLVGVLGIRDEIRPESVAAIEEVHNAGVQVVMITGDRKETAVAIARESGVIAAETDVVLTSTELREMSDEEIGRILPDLRVIARALPSDKSRLVGIAQSKGMVVGMTGDGVNDSPALKKADVGFAMGSGTEVAKEASGIVIMNDNFKSIEKAILYGRTIFNNIRKFIVFQLTINVAAVLISLITPLLGQESPLSITQILWVNLIMDTLAALAFGGEPALDKYMREKPKKRDEDIASKRMWSAILTGGLYLFVIGMIFLNVPWFKTFFGENTILGVTGETLHTGFFTMFILTAVFNMFNARTEEFNLFSNIKKNKGFIRIVALIVAVQIIMVYLGSTVFNCYGLGILQWLLVVAMAVTIIPVDLARKAIADKVKEKRKSAI